MSRRRHPVEHHGPETACSRCAKTCEPITVAGVLHDDVYHGGIACVCCGRVFCKTCALELGLVLPGKGVQQTCKACGIYPCRPAVKPYRLVIEVKLDDGGAVDAEHIVAVAALKEGATLEAVQQKLRACARPATAREWVDA